MMSSEKRGLVLESWSGRNPKSLKVQSCHAFDIASAVNTQSYSAELIDGSSHLRVLWGLRARNPRLTRLYADEMAKH